MRFHDVRAVLVPIEKLFTVYERPGDIVPIIAPERDQRFVGRLRFGSEAAQRADPGSRISVGSGDNQGVGGAKLGDGIGGDRICSGRAFSRGRPAGLGFGVSLDDVDLVGGGAAGENR